VRAAIAERTSAPSASRWVSLRCTHPTDYGLVGAEVIEEVWNERQAKS